MHRSNKQLDKINNNLQSEIDIFQLGLYPDKNYNHLMDNKGKIWIQNRKREINYED